MVQSQFTGAPDYTGALLSYGNGVYDTNANARPPPARQCQCLQLPRGGSALRRRLAGWRVSGQPILSGYNNFSNTSRSAVWIIPAYLQLRI